MNSNNNNNKHHTAKKKYPPAIRQVCTENCSYDYFELLKALNSIHKTLSV